MNVLVDTSVWVDHFRRRNAALVSLLESDLVLSHPMVVLELACGTPPEPRAGTLGFIATLRTASQAAMSEVAGFIERERLYGLGCGLVDLSLLASAMMTPDTLLWSLDRRLSALADRFGVAHRAAPH